MRSLGVNTEGLSSQDGDRASEAKTRDLLLPLATWTALLAPRPRAALVEVRGGDLTGRGSTKGDRRGAGGGKYRHSLKGVRCEGEPKDRMANLLHFKNFQSPDM